MLIVAALATIAVTAGLTWVLWRINYGREDRDS